MPGCMNVVVNIYSGQRREGKEREGDRYVCRNYDLANNIPHRSEHEVRIVVQSIHIYQACFVYKSPVRRTHDHLHD